MNRIRTATERILCAGYIIIPSKDGVLNANQYNLSNIHWLKKLFREMVGEQTAPHKKYVDTIKTLSVVYLGSKWISFVVHEPHEKLIPDPVPST